MSLAESWFYFSERGRGEGRVNGRRNRWDGKEEPGKSQGSVVFLLAGTGPASQLAGSSSSVCFQWDFREPYTSLKCSRAGGKSGMHPSAGTRPLVSLTLPTGNGSIRLVRVSSCQHGLIWPTRGHSATSGDIFCHNRRSRMNSSSGI